MSAQYDQRLQTYSQNSIRPTPLTRSQPMSPPLFLFLPPLTTPPPPCTLHHIFPPLRQQTHAHPSHSHTPQVRYALCSLPRFLDLCSHTGRYTSTLLILLCLSPPLSPLSQTPVRHSLLLLLFLLPPPAPLFIHIQKHTSHPSKVSIIDTVRCCIVVCLPVCYNLIVATLLHPSFPPFISPCLASCRP